MTSPYQVAQGWAGTREGDAALNDFLYNGGQNLDAQTRAWCSDFIKAAASKSGISTNATGSARSWLNEGTPVDQPQPGDVAVLSRTNDPSKGHVGFYEGTNPDGTIKLLSGNHANQVASANYPMDRVLGYRRLGPALDPRNVAMNSGSAGVDPDGAAGISGLIHTSNPTDTGVASSAFTSPNMPTPATSAGTGLAGAFQMPGLASLGKGAGALAGAFGGNESDDSAQKANAQALEESERAALAALQSMMKRPKRTMANTMAPIEDKRLGAFA